jgi:hypothetical protein
VGYFFGLDFEIESKIIVLVEIAGYYGAFLTLPKVASLPFRFKGSNTANMAPAAVSTQHSHRSTTKNPHKAFKSRHLSKGALKDLAKGVITVRAASEPSNCAS